MFRLDLFKGARKFEAVRKTVIQVTAIFLKKSFKKRYL